MFSVGHEQAQINPNQTGGAFDDVSGLTWIGLMWFNLVQADRIGLISRVLA